MQVNTNQRLSHIHNEWCKNQKGCALYYFGHSPIHNPALYSLVNGLRLINLSGNVNIYQ